MTCAERRDDWLLYVAGTLDEGERRALRAHLAAGCPTCAAALAEAEAVLQELPLALDPVAPSPGLRQRVLARGQASTREASRGEIPRIVPLPPRVEARGGAWLRPALAAALAAAAMFFFVALPMRSSVVSRLEQQDARIAELERESEASEAVASQQTVEIEQLRAQVAAARRLARVQSRPETLVVALQGVEDPQGAARIFWDRSAARWYLFASGIVPPGPGRTHQLWFITPSQQKISAGTFVVDENGDASYEVQVPADIGPIAAAAFTDEPSGGSNQPTGKIRVLGSLRAAT